MRLFEFLKTTNSLDADGKPTASGKELLKFLEGIRDVPPVSTKRPEEKLKLTHPPHL